MKNIVVEYLFKLNSGKEELFHLEFDREDFELIRNTSKRLPKWTALGFHQCSNCPFDPEKRKYCPLCAGLVDMLKRLGSIKAYDELTLTVKTEQRTIMQETVVHVALSSMMGLIIAASGCPHTVFFRPMARFHLPLASEEETLYRVTSMYLLAQYFIRKDGKGGDFSLEGLNKIYKNIQLVNTSMVTRLHAATRTGSSVNAVFLLDSHAQLVPYYIMKSLEDIRYIFTPYLKKQPPSVF